MSSREVWIHPNRYRLMKLINMFDKLIFMSEDSWPHYILRREMTEFTRKYGRE